jgi:long-chain acyl-CoA synthetase
MTCDPVHAPKQVGLDISEADCTLSYLTLAHIFGRCLEEFALSVGAHIGYWQARALPMQA